VATPGLKTVQYGGNTSCVEASLDDGTVLVLDAGTGIIGLGAELRARGARRIHLLLTHLHLDHLEGLRFFAPLWDERVSIDIWGPPSPVSSLRDRISRSFCALFPIDLRDVQAGSRSATCRASRGRSRARRWRRIGPPSGPDGRVRVENGSGASFAIYPTTSPRWPGDSRPIAGLDLGCSLAQEVDVLFHDAQYSRTSTRRRWGGHSVSPTRLCSRAR
jgi:ribonuclease BN (tRNA processing enzyme)